MELEERIARLERLIGGHGIKTTGGDALSGEDAVAWMDSQGMSIYAGLANTQEAVGQLAGATATAAVAAGAPADAVAAVISIAPPGFEILPQ